MKRTSTDETDPSLDQAEGRLCAEGCGELDDNFGAGLDRMVEMLSDIVGVTGGGAGEAAAEEAVPAAEEAVPAAAAAAAAAAR